METQTRKEEMTSMLVQEIARKGDSVPERHKLKQDDTITPAIDAPSHIWEHTLQIDYSLLSPSRSPSVAHQKELAKLHSALKDWGCFQVINHDIPSLFLEELLQVTKQFFNLPVEEKLKYSVTHDFFNGYSNANQIVGNTPQNWCDRLFLSVFPEELRRLDFWPEKPDTFRDILHEYSLKLRVILDSLLKAMARSLSLEEDRFITQHGNGGSISARFGIYPPCPCPDRVYGVSPHSDESTFTVLLQDNDVAEGLHILKGDQWFKVPVIPGALFINLGDFTESSVSDRSWISNLHEDIDMRPSAFCMFTSLSESKIKFSMVMSNGIFKSVIHRVVTNPVKERVSVAAFCTPEPERDVEPIAELIKIDRPKMYKMVNKKTYKQIYMQTYPQGKKVVDALKV